MERNLKAELGVAQAFFAFPSTRQGRKFDETLARDTVDLNHISGILIERSFNLESSLEHTRLEPL